MRVSKILKKKKKSVQRLPLLLLLDTLETPLTTVNMKIQEKTITKPFTHKHPAQLFLKKQPNLRLLYLRIGTEACALWR